ncbi:MAG: SH3 domain-containing protein, partial [Clostridia bacterium]|nr:SH3 domain-containing protein [Clostridia bacterium]
LSYNGRTTGSTTINVRNAASGDSAKIAEWETGTEVEVFGQEKGWYEIEHDGIHGFVMEKFLTLQEESR